jgi:hypothetical protein
MSDDSALAAHPYPESDPRRAQTGAGARGLAAAEAVCTAAGDGSQKAARAAGNKNGRCARVGDREARVDLSGVNMAETVDAGKTPLCFVIGPIGKDFSQERKHADLLLHAVIKHVLEAEEFGYKVKRADEEPDPGMIGDRVISDILHAQLVVADLTDLNPNAFYELGIRRSTMKPTIHLAKSGTPLPFDNVTHRTIFVDLAEWQSIERGRAQLAASARAIQDPGFQVSNPITQANASFKMRESADPLHRVIAEIGERVRVSRAKNPARPSLEVASAGAPANLTFSTLC